jgi:hypothetical protein
MNFVQTPKNSLSTFQSTSFGLSIRCNIQFLLYTVNIIFAFSHGMSYEEVRNIQPCCTIQNVTSLGSAHKLEHTVFVRRIRNLTMCTLLSVLVGKKTIRQKFTNCVLLFYTSPISDTMQSALKRIYYLNLRLRYLFLILNIRRRGSTQKNAYNTCYLFTKHDLCVYSLEMAAYVKRSTLE